MDVALSVNSVGVRAGFHLSWPWFFSLGVPLTLIIISLVCHIVGM